MAVANVGGGWRVADRYFADEASAYRAAARYNTARGVEYGAMERIRASAAAAPARGVSFRLPKAFEFSSNVFEGFQRYAEPWKEAAWPVPRPDFPLQLSEESEAAAEDQLAGCYWAWSVVELIAGWGVCAIAANRAGVYVSPEFVSGIREMAIATADANNHYRGLSKAQAARIIASGQFADGCVGAHLDELLRAGEYPYSLPTGPDSR
ncbi:hypothetical protein RM531_15655 [Salinisphaera sp. P385]|uniref:Uncharacterized protein n=1 Tax=Spectribacter acetivorans TaxID=3075603 RepID=A0ABU3BE16_9GAMM|nr:hypothetical protein [Salinisphaera sp. P385]MDT0619906.1 hypothetical protein [Salinisphaera sp. P385]